MAYSLANTAHTNGNLVTSLTVPASTINNLGILSCCIDHASPGINSIPTGGGTWARIGNKQNDAGNGQDVTWFYVVFTSSVTSVSWSGAWNASAICYCEFSGAATSTPLDVEDSTKAFASTSVSTDGETSNNITPAASGELIVVHFGDTGGFQASITQGTGFTAGVVDVGVSGSGADGLCWKTGGSGSQNGTFTVGTASHNYTNQIAAFKAAGGGGTTVKQLAALGVG